MKQIIAYIGSHNHLTINLCVDGVHRVRTVPYDHEHIDKITNAVQDGDADLVYELLDVPHQISSFSDGVIQLDGNVLLWDEAPLSNTLTKRILKLRDEGAKFQYLIEFLKRLMQNPSKRAVEELYTFLEHKDLPITTDGYFLAYKAVTSDFKDKYSGTVDNSVGGAIPRMPRNMVCDDKDKGCSTGYHAGTLNYVQGFGNSVNGDKTVIVKIDPADVVSIPLDHSCEKLRCSWYQVIGLYDGPLTNQVYGGSGEVIDYSHDDVDLDDEDESEWSDVSEEDDEDTDENVCTEIIDFLDDNIGNRAITVAVLMAMFESLSIEEIESCIEDSSVYTITDGVVHYL